MGNVKSKIFATEFLKWCNTPMHRDDGSLSSKLRAIPQLPDYDTYIVIDADGKNRLAQGMFLTVEELYEYWLLEEIWGESPIDIND